MTFLVPVALLSLFTLLLVYAHGLFRGSLRLPPGPTPVPLLGNIHQLPKNEIWKALRAWGVQYGDVVFARFLGTRVLVVNSLQAAQDLMDKKSSIYSDRPRFTLHVELMGLHSMTSHMRYGERFRKQRRWIHNAVQDKDAVRTFRPMRQRETYILLSNLIERPDDYVTHMEQFMGALVMEVAYGHTVRSSDDKYVQIVRQATTAVSDVGSPAAMFVDFFPALKFLPSWMSGGSFQREAAAVRILVRKLLDVPYDMVKSALATGTAVPSLTSSLLEQAISEGKLTDEEEEDIKGTAGVLFGAGTETTVTTLSVFFLTMVLHPEVYKKAQEEVDRVVGRGRLPDFNDRDSLPYLECVLKEVYRWNVLLPLGIPHQLMHDDEYSGYHIPGDTMVFPNIWAMSQDPKFYPDPERFHTERFEEMDANAAELRDPWHIIFGFGRRICPGRRFADEAIWIAIANIVATLNISKARDAHGEDITPPLAFSGGFSNCPAPFRCSILPRSKAAVDLVSQMRANVAA